MASAVVCGLPIAFAAQEPVVAPNVYVNCQWHVAAIFPGQPIVRDITYTDKWQDRSARQFYFDRGADHYSVTSRRLLQWRARD
jgi:hypothetical protein